ncbi:MAG TPA: capsid cement protein [Rhodanobacter sp.]|nr:capsid cement protein [Rhodanobacter sp.]
MARNYVNPGEHITFTAAADVASGAGLAIGSMLAVALGAVATGAEGTAAIEGVWELPKLGTAVITAGAPLIWDVSAGQFIVASAATGDLLTCAVAVEAAGNGTTTVRAKLTPGAGSVSA